MIYSSFGMAAAIMEASNQECLKLQESVRKQIEEKGYAEREVDADEARRRYRIVVTELPRHPVKHSVGLGVRKTF